MIAHNESLQQVNQNPLNQRALELLRQAKQPAAAGDGLYLVQLAQWALDREKNLDPRQRTRLQSTLDECSRMKPDQAWQFLSGETQDETLLPDNYLTSTDPTQAGNRLLEHLITLTQE